MEEAVKRGGSFLKEPRDADKRGVLFPLKVEKLINDDLLVEQHILDITENHVYELFFPVCGN